MKQSTNTETVNESLTNITPGEWIVTHDNRWPMTWAIRTKEWHIASLNPFSPEQENAKANAEIICKAVNERQSLLDALKLAINQLNVIKNCKTLNTAKECGAMIQEGLETALNNTQ